VTARMTLRELRSFYAGHLTRVILPFWIERGIDRGHGGFYTCFENSGARLRSTDKYTWSQGRFLWVLSRLCADFANLLDPAALAACEGAMKRGAEFLRSHAIADDGRVHWALDEEGRPLLVDRFGKQAAPGEPGVQSITADLFLIYGFAEFARSSGERAYLDLASSLFDSAAARIASGDFRWAPHQGNPRGFRLHGVPMIMLETAQELALAAERFDTAAAGRYAGIARRYLEEIRGTFLAGDLIREMVREEGAKKRGELLGSFVNPGHALEDSWFMLHFAMRHGAPGLVPAVLGIIRRTVAVGWDAAHGGLLLYAHESGGCPRGEVRPENEGEPIVASLANDWDQKLWWVHSEALYALLLAHELSGDPWFLEQHRKVHGYVFALFPNPDPRIGEWIQIRDRAGSPIDRVVALPVKDPMHTARALMNAITSLERQANG
jgi:N-acylglucosamine 2-epimerase